MAQNYVIDSYQTTAKLVPGMQQYEDNFECLRTLFAGASEPSITKVAGMPWYDTTDRLLKIRNSVNDDWLGVMHGNAEMKIWIFKNVANYGWTIDDSVADVVLAFKGNDSTGVTAYDTTGGGIAGTWTQPDHILTEAQIPAHTHGSAGAHTHPFYHYGGGAAAYAVDPSGLSYNWSSGYTKAVQSGGAHTHTGGGSDEAHDHGNTYRPYASVGTLQFLNV